MIEWRKWWCKLISITCIVKPSVLNFKILLSWKNKWVNNIVFKVCINFKKLFFNFPKKSFHWMMNNFLEVVMHVLEICLRHHKEMINLMANLSAIINGDTWFWDLGFQKLKGRPFPLWLSVNHYGVHPSKVQYSHLGIIGYILFYFMK